jgi:predicted DNA-binding transcriptional regulator AlpA
MTYNSGISWNLTMIDGKSITWVGDRDYRAVASVLDPGSDRPACRVLRDGSVHPLTGQSAGLTVYGTHAWDRPTFALFGEIAPEYAYLVEGIDQRRGVTHHRITCDPETVLLSPQEVAARIGVVAATVHRYHSKGIMPAPDGQKGRTPLWRASTIDAWERPGRGAGGGRPSQKGTVAS